MEETIKCCTVSCERPLDREYWDSQYRSGNTAWDIGFVSPAIRQYLDGLTDKSMRILIPGCGNSYEAEYLLQQGYQNITVIDISEDLTRSLSERFAGNDRINVVTGDFFEHNGQYDLILEQTFFCALPPSMRQRYVFKIWGLLADEGILAGLLFNREFETGPPFGGTMNEYERLFFPAFQPLHWAACNNSIPKRAGSELFMELRKNASVHVASFQVKGITCSGCMNSVCSSMRTIPSVLSASMSTDFQQLLLVSSQPLDISALKLLVEPEYEVQAI